MELEITFAVLNRNFWASLNDPFFILLLYHGVSCLSSPKIWVLLSGLLKAGSNLAFSAAGISKENN